MAILGKKKCLTYQCPQLPYYMTLEKEQIKSKVTRKKICYKDKKKTSETGRKKLRKINETKY